MAKSRYISEFERNIIRIGVAKGLNAPQIAKFLKRGKMVVYNHIKAMRADDTLNDLPVCEALDEIASAISESGQP